jgi:hypothetical protein
MRMRDEARYQQKEMQPSFKVCDSVILPNILS